MRYIKQDEKTKRGCKYCEDATKPPDGRGNRVACPHEACPYTELDKFNSYEEFIKSKESVAGVAWLLRRKGGTEQVMPTAILCRSLRKKVYSRFF